MKFLEKIKKDLIVASKKFLLFFKKKKTKTLIKKLIWIFSIILVISVFFVFLVLSIYGPWWKIWPKKIEGSIALNRLAISVYEEPYCRADCYLERESYRQAIIKRLNQPKFVSRLEKIVFNEEENLNWRLEIISILSLIKNDLAIEKYQNYLDSDLGNLEIKKALNYYFSDNLISFDYYNNLKKTINDISISEEEKILSLKNLETSNQSLANFYLNILKENIGEDFKLEILKALASDSGRLSLPLNELLIVLEKIIYFSNYYQSKRVALFILSDFLENSKNIEAHDWLIGIIEEGDIDKFSKYLAIDIINNYLEEKYDFPSISSKEWDYYYGQK